MNIKTFLLRGTFFLLLGSLFSCQNNQTINAENEFREKQQIAFSKNLEIPEGNKVMLTAAAKEKVSEWPAFLTAKTEVEQMKAFTVRDAVQNSKNLSAVMKTLAETLPEEMQTKPILARLSVLRSLTGMLGQIAANPNAPANEINHVAGKIPVAFENLKIQINEANRKGLEDFRVGTENEPKPVLAPVLERGPVIKKPE